MNEQILNFLTDEVLYITGKGTVLSGELLYDITLGENILIASADGSLYTTKTILGIGVFRNGYMEETRNANGGETVEICVDLPKEKICKDMGVFKEKEEVVEPSEEIILPSNDEIFKFFDKTIENSVKPKTSELNIQIAKYLVFLNNKKKDLIYFDDYGDLCFDLWWEECTRFIDRKLLIIKLEIIEECRLLLKQNYKHKSSDAVMEIYDEYLLASLVIRITNNIDELLKDFDN